MGQDVVCNHKDNIQRLARFDKDQWNSLLRDRVLEKEWSRERTMNEIREYFGVGDEEQEWMENFLA